MTHARYGILAMLFVVTTMNYVDRATLSMAAPAIGKDLGIEAVRMGFAFSAFGWAYTIFQIPGGWVLDRFGSKRVYGIGLLLWSVFTFLQGSAALLHGTAAFLLICAMRFLMGISEAPAFPANSRITAMWFPRNERGTAAAIFNSSQYFALAAFNPVMGLILSHFGWEHIFHTMGFLGVLLVFVWFKVICDPNEHPRISKEEINYIQQGGGLTTLESGGKKMGWFYVRQILRSRMMMGVFFAQFCINVLTWFFLTWFPTYLVQAKGMSILKVGFVAAIPAIAGFLGCVGGGYFSDWLLKRGKSLTFARKMPIVTGMLLSSSIILANYVQSELFVIIVMTVAFCAKGFGALGWPVMTDIAPKEMVGVSGGIFNFCGSLASIVTPIVIGYMVNTQQSFNGALIFVGVMGFLGACSYLFLVGELKRLELVSEPEAAPVR